MASGAVETRFLGFRVQRYLCIIERLFALAALFICCVRAYPAMAESAPVHLRIGFSSKAFISVPKDDIKIAVQVLSKKVAGKSSLSAESRIYDISTEIEKDLKAKKVDLIALSPEEFIQIRAHVPLEPVMVTVDNRGHEVELLLLVRKDSGINRVAELKNRTISLPSRTSQFSAIYHIWLESLVMKEGAGSTEGFFTSILEMRNASQALMQVFFRKADSCVISVRAYEIASELNPQISRELKVIARVGKLVGGIMAQRGNLPEEIKLKIRQALITLHEDQEGRQMFVLFQLNRLTPFRPEYMKGIEALYAEHRRLKADRVRR